jgi:hypothetical protein
MYRLGSSRLIESIDPVPVAVSGNYLVFRFYGTVGTDEWSTLKSKLGTDMTPREDMVPLPSGGVFAEAVLGCSNSAEKLDITRFWNWQDSPIPILPSEINPLTAGGKGNDKTPETGKLESPIVNIVNPPALPDPAGLGPLYAAIANGNMFRDMSGLAQTSALIGAALQAAQAGAANATGAAGEAQKVAAQQLTEILKLAAQVAGGGVASGAGAGLGALGSASKPGVTNTPSNAGALINHGKSMDDRRLTDTLPPSAAGPVTPSGDPASEWLPYPGTDSNSTLVSDSDGFEARATEVALSGSSTSGEGSSLIGQILRTVMGAAPGSTSSDVGMGASQAVFPWGLLAKWSGTDRSGVPFAKKYQDWVDQSHSHYNEMQFLCNWYPLMVLVDFAAANGLRIRLQYWKGSAPIDGSPRRWDTARTFIHDSHSGRFESKEAFYNVVKSTVTARMIGTLNTTNIARSQAKAGDLVLYDSSDVYWHVELIVSISPTSMTLQAGNTPMCKPTDNGKTAGSDTPRGAYGGSPRRWNFGQFDE